MKEIGGWTYNVSTQAVCGDTFCMKGRIMCKTCPQKNDERGAKGCRQNQMCRLVLRRFWGSLSPLTKAFYDCLKGGTLLNPKLDKDRSYRCVYSDATIVLV